MSAPSSMNQTKTVGRSNAAFLDASARSDPFVRGLDDFFEIGIGQNSFRHIRTDASDGTGAALEVVAGSRIFEFVRGG